MTSPNRSIAAAAVAATLVAGGMAATPASAQYNAYGDFGARCRTDSGMLQAEACMAALRYEPSNPEYLRRMGDGLLAANRPGAAFDAYTDCLAISPAMVEARNGRDEAMRQISGRYSTVPVAAVNYVPVQPVYVPVQQVYVPQAQPVPAHPYDGTWRGHIEPRGQRFPVQATIVGGQFRMFYEDSADRVVLEGSVDGSGYFSGRGIVKDKAGGPAGGGGEPLAMTGRFTEHTFEGTGSTGSKFTTILMSRAGS